MKTTIKAYLHMENLCPRTWSPSLWPTRLEQSSSVIFIGEMNVEVEVPDDFDPVPTQVAALEKLKRDALERYQREVAEIQVRLQKLLAITCETFK